MKRRVWQGSILCAAALGLMSVSVRAASPPDDPARVRLREIVSAKIVFDKYVLDNPVFPHCDFEDPARMKELLGTYIIQPTFYNAEYKPVTAPDDAGPYGAVVEIRAEKAPPNRPLRRFATFYRLVPGISGVGAKQDPVFEVARLAGIPEPVAQRQRTLVEERLRVAQTTTISKDQQFAELLVGLHESEGGDPAILHKWDDGYASERQWWVGLKRKLNGQTRLFSRSIVAPQKLKGAPAPTVRQGSLAEAGMKPDAKTRIDDSLRDWAADTDEAFAVCIVRHGVVAFYKAYGSRDGLPITIDTKSWMASITKTMSACLMMELVDQGIVGLDDPVEKYVPALRGITVPKPLTIRHLYTHTAGLAAWPAWEDQMPDVEQRISDYYPFLEVGKEWSYTGTGNVLGGKIIEAVSDEAIPQFFQNHLLLPLEMTHTDVAGTFGDAYSTPLDMAKFGQMLLNGGAYGNQRFFRKETFQKMLPQKLTMLLGPDATKVFGIGLDGTPQKFGHGAASAATFQVDVANDMVVIMTRNKIGTNYDKYNGKFWQAIQDSVAN